MAVLLSELAEKTACRLVGNDCLIENVADISQAQPGYLAFCNHARYQRALQETQASAVIVGKEWLALNPVASLVSDNPRLAFAKAAILLNPPDHTGKGQVASSAVVADSAVLGDKVTLGENVVIGAGCQISKNVSIGAGSVLGDNVIVGENTEILPNVTIHRDCIIGGNCIIHSGVVIGTDGFGFIMDEGRYLKIPQLGKVVIGDDVDIGANTTIDRGALLDTVIGNGVKLDNQIQIAHNVEIGDHTLISANTGVAGSTKIGRYCMLGGGVGVRDNIEIVDKVVVTGRTFVSSSIKEAGYYSSSILVDTTRNWKKNVMRFKQLDGMAKRLKKLEKQLEKPIE